MSFLIVIVKTDREIDFAMAVEHGQAKATRAAVAEAREAWDKGDTGMLFSDLFSETMARKRIRHEILDHEEIDKEDL